ncbi:MAG: 16S rRNA (guanine(966)-N(2))-methyltransferase RsmD [Candidatus Dasytiphilus stammeri]
MNKKHINITSSSNSNIRIIGGLWRSRKLKIISNTKLRPTLNKVRETLFNWLTSIFFFQKVDCLDCYAGSGALAIETLSRFAAKATLLEINRSVVIQLQKNLFLLATNNRATVIQTNTINWLSTFKNQFNLVFIDPPFHHMLINRTINLLEENGWLTDNAWIYIESHINNKILRTPSHWELYRENITGQVYYCLYHRTR